ncbi:MAG: hypothetical protein M1587_03315 [Thaumarchaeota archaeon]|nr:hypothetical protein [Nitrososphaerota archaeon]
MSKSAPIAIGSIALISTGSEIPLLMMQVLAWSIVVVIPTNTAVKFCLGKTDFPACPHTK